MKRGVSSGYRATQMVFAYALIIAVVVGAFLTIQSIVKRGLEGNYKNTADSIGKQYSPGRTQITTTSTRSSRDYPGQRGVATTVEETTKTTTTIAPLGKEHWPASWQ